MQDHFTPLLTAPNKNQHWVGEFVPSPKHYQRLARNHLQCAGEYSLACAQAINAVGLVTEPQWVALLCQATELAYLYEYYLDNATEALRFRNHGAVFQEILAAKGYSFGDNLLLLPPPRVAPTQWLRNTLHPEVNIVRLIGVRTKKMLATLATTPLLPRLTEIMTRINSNQFLRTVIRYQAWVFFTPRLLVNLLLLGKHALPGSWMSEEERSLGFKVRMEAYWQQHWFEIANDSLWLTMGILGCFMLTAPATFAILSFGLFVIDIVLGAIRAGQELSRFKAMDPSEETPAYQKRKAFEQRKHAIYFANTVFLAVGMLFTLPFIAGFYMAIALGATLVLVTTLANYVALKINDRTRPVDDVTVLRQHNLFPSAEKKQDFTFTSTHKLY